MLSGMATCVGYLNQRRLVVRFWPRFPVTWLSLLISRHQPTKNLKAMHRDQQAIGSNFILCRAGPAFWVAHPCGSPLTWLTPEGIVLLCKPTSTPSIPMPSHPDVAVGQRPTAEYLPVSYGCCDVVQSALVSNAACVPCNPMSLTRMDLPSPIGCAMASSNSVIALPRTYSFAKARQGQQTVKFIKCKAAVRPVVAAEL